ncbi:peptide chain release factor N(5)-glutamine methyltransferase [bacterium]|nr:peptide chain release factor N(5)-glutamine methyltransferase [bacterium]
MEIKQRLAKGNFETAGNVSLLLLAHVTGQSKTWLLAHDQDPITPEQISTLHSETDRLLQGVPLPHILGQWSFYGRDFTVSPDVLIPRPETELLIERAIAFCEKRPRSRIVDVGTGSGIIAISIAAAFPGASVIATDWSRAALSVASQNAARYHLAHIGFLQADLIQGLLGPFDLICANLPYIPTETLNALDVAQWEPRLALDGGPDGLDLIRRLLKQARTRLTPQGSILLEIESTIGEAALTAAKDAFPNAQIELHADLAGKDRLIEIQQA